MTYIEKYRQEDEHRPESELLALKHQFADPQHPAHIVACQLLNEKKVARETDQHRKARRLTKISISVTASGIVISIWMHYELVPGIRTSS
jgi:hypothetical protein